MKKYLPSLLVVGLLCGMVLPAAVADDEIQLHTGRTVRGIILSMTPATVSVETRDGEQNLPTSSIELIEFDKEPASMKLARSAALGGRHEDALKYFDERVDEDELPPGRTREIKQDIEYYKAYSTAQLALGGQGELQAAQGALTAFLQNNSSSYHSLAAKELLGDVENALGNYAAAEEAYNSLTTSSSPLFQRRGQVAKGYAMLKQGKVAEASSTFSQVTASSPGEDPQMQKYHLMAQLGTAACLGERGNTDQAVQMVRKIVAETEEDQQLYARAFNTLGGIYRNSGDAKKALLEYLKVDKLYFTASQEHAEALYYLADLWNKVDSIPGNQQYAQRCADLLKSRYPNSSWAQQ